jgi:hypothetical protein
MKDVKWTAFRIVSRMKRESVVKSVTPFANMSQQRRKKDYFIRQESISEEKNESSSRAMRGG